MKARQTIYFWDGIFDVNNLMTAEYQAVMQKLVNGEYAELNLEKLRGYNVFSIRINKADRVLFTTIQVNDRPFLMILDIVNNHDYAKSRFLKKGVLREYIDNFDTEVFEQIIDDHFEACKELDFAFEGGECDYVPAKRFGRKYIEFDLDQQKACKAALPLILTGAAGAGKSCAGFQLVTDFATRNLEDLTHPVLYVAASQNLCRSMERNWQSLPISGRDEKGYIKFQTYAEVIRFVDPSIEALDEVDENEFISFISESIKQKRKQDKSKRAKNTFPKKFFEDKDALYQECRIICGCTDLAEYEKLGQHQAILKDKEQRQWLFKEYKAYLTYLKNNNKYDLAFYTPKTEKHFELVVVDETPDLSRLQIKVLRNLSIDPEDKQKRPNIVYCEDPRQNLYNNVDMRSYFGILLNAKKEEVSFISLNTSHRCPVAVVKMADSMTQLGARLAGQRAPEAAKVGDNTEQGDVEWLDQLTEEDMQSLHKDAETAGFAVVTLPEYVELAKKLFKTELVFTVEQIKGLEYPKVLMYRLMDAPVYFAANNHLAALEKQGGKSERQDQFPPAFNLLYTACTRATKSLCIVQDNPETAHRLEHLTNWLKGHTFKSELKPENVCVETNWLEEAKNQLLAGNHNVANDICKQRLQMSEEQYQSFKDKYLDEPKAAMVVKKTTTKKQTVSKSATPAKPIVPLTKKTKKTNGEMCIDPRNEKLAYDIAKDILYGPTDIYKVKKIFEDETVQFYLFIPLSKFEGESLFTLLFSTQEYRNYVTETLIPENPRIARYFADHSLGGANAKVGSLHGKLPPLFWMSKSAKCMTGLISEPKFYTKMSNIFSDEKNYYLLYLPKVTNPDCTTCSLFWLTTHEAGLLILAEIFSKNPSLASVFSKDVIFIKHRIGKKYCSIFSNLYQSDVGIGILQILLENNPNLAKSIAMPDLFPPTATEYETPRLLNVVRQNIGRSLIVCLQSQRHDLIDSDLTKINELEAFALQEQYNNPEFVYAKELAWIDKLLANPVEVNFDNLFKNSKWHVYMFDVPVRDGECLFTVLFDDVKTRNIMLKYVLPKYKGYFSNNMTGSALCRVESTEGTMPPLFWMMGSVTYVEILCNWLDADENLLGECSLDAFYCQISLVQYMRSGIPPEASALHGVVKPIFKKDTEMMLSAFKLMVINASKLLPTIQLIDNNTFNITLEEILEITYVSGKDETRKEYTLLDLLCKSEYGLQALASILKSKNIKIAEQFDEKILCTGGEIAANDHQGKCILFDMLASKAGLLALGVILVSNTILQKTKFAELLLYGFTKECKDDSMAVSRLAYLCSSMPGIFGLNQFMSQHLDLIAKFDKSLFSRKFLKGTPPDEQKHKHQMVKSLESNENGKILLDNIRSFLNESASTNKNSIYKGFTLFSEDYMTKASMPVPQLRK